MFKVSMESEKFGQVGNMINSVAYTLNTPAHINELITAAHRIITGEFIVHMSNVAFNSPKEFQHMYEWGRVGDPNARLWKHILRGSGSGRVTTFDFKASKTPVPVSPEKQAVGVQRNHIFVWKAPVLELGLPVRISPKIATNLVIQSKSSPSLIYTNKTIYIPRQGSESVWGAFTAEYMKYFTSGTPAALIKNVLEPKIQAGVRQAMSVGIRRLAKTSKPKTFTITPVGIDKNFITTMNNAMRTSYIDAARNRRIDE